MPSVSSNRGYVPRQEYDTAFPRVPKLAVNNIIGLDKYYRSATLLLRQVGPTCGPIPRAVVLSRITKNIRWCCRRTSTGTPGTITSCTLCSCALPGVPRCALVQHLEALPLASVPKLCATACSLVLETIPQHANFGKGGRREYEQERFKEVSVPHWPR